MKILVKYSSKHSKRNQFVIDVDPHQEISQLKKTIISLIGPVQVKINLITEICGVKILMSDNWPISFYHLEPNSKIEVKQLEFSCPSPTKRKLNRGSTYMESLGFENYLPITREYGPLEKAIDACKAGNLADLMRTVEVYESESPDDEDLLNQAQPCLWAPIHYACSYGHSAIISYLVGRRVNSNKVTIDEWTPLQLCCFQGHADCVEALMEHPNLQLDKMTKFRGTGLHLACERGHADIAKTLLEANACMSLEDPRGKTPIELAKDHEILTLLPVYLGECQLRKYQQESETPPPFCGEIWMTGSLFIHDRPVFLYMDLDKGALDRYTNKEDFLDKVEPECIINLSDVQDVRVIGGSKTQFFFSIETARNSYKYYTKHQDLTKEWVNRIKQGVSYCLVHRSKDSVLKKNTESIASEVAEDETVSSENPSVLVNDEVINFNSFTILDQIGSGSFGTVYKVQKRNGDQQEYAMKSLSKANLQRQKQLKYAISECRIMKQLKHPFIVTLYYAFQTTQYLYLILEYCPNGDLLGLLESNKIIEENIAKFYLAEVILALEYLHSLEIIYRDLKPANVLIDSSGHAKLADFGLAKENVSKDNPAMTMAGSPAYLPPEIVAKKGASKASDIYGIGPLLYELLTGAPPYYSQDIDVLFQSIKQARLSFPPHVSSTARDLITQVMNRDPAKRPQISQIKRHPFFRKLDWEALLARRIRLPRNGSFCEAMSPTDEF
ncbi:unnamed protein product [Blepharisma stoltei]|uniref:Protein kinase domain-containing protein n=1 Tax=Blepharisma stoltei TaxID=1481888 RepID=A0AAU9K3R5_9CILI|nr:unnamed protein product [Blepharisma stoltei]